MQDQLAPLRVLLRSDIVDRYLASCVPPNTFFGRSIVGSNAFFGRSNSLVQWNPSMTECTAQLVRDVVRVLPV
ncbi:hypothetical protein HPB50_021449 [Hyalomma asiaticum]|uniref:Uncharacterized protein n=1 Tax=Hyalomma asiaticum TaxID=266040 RepID=A0ACB7RW51_HYAAI|nr:hypothetical protein HPB50_021449 [Hyalomma asiaticum]